LNGKKCELIIIDLVHSCLFTVIICKIRRRWSNE
jgi:hypothetical protein